MTSPASEIFSMMAESLRMGRVFEGAHPTEHAKATQQELADALSETPRPELTPEDINIMAAMEDEKFSEGRRRHPRIPSPHFD